MTPSSVSASPPAQSLCRAAAALLAVQFVLMWAAFFVLSSAVGWPASLDLPAAEKLALFAAHERASLVGYALYAGSALLLVPTAVLLRRALWGGARSGAASGSVLGDLSAALGVSAGLVKAAALSRWLLLAPVLAAATVGASADAQATVAAVFGAFDALGGGVGEVLGVGLLSGAWTAALAAGLWAVGARMLAVAGLASAALLLLSVPAGFGLDLGPVLTVSGVAWQLWLAALAVWLVRAQRTGPVASGHAAPDGAPRRAPRGLRRTVLAGAALAAVLAAPAALAQAPVRGTVAEVGVGLGKSEFYGRLEAGDEARDALGFSPNLGGTLSLAVYQRAGWASDRLWLGGRFKVQVAAPTSGDGPEEYFFNHYYGGASARYYALSDRRAGPFVQADLTYGQFTEKLRDPSTDRAEHQFAVGPGVLGAVGYALPVGGERRVNVSLYVQRNVGNGDVDGEGEVGFDYGALGAEVVLGF